MEGQSIFKLNIKDFLNMEKYPILATNLDYRAPKEVLNDRENPTTIESPLHIIQDVGFNLYAYQIINEKCHHIKEK